MHGTNLRIPFAAALGLMAGLVGREAIAAEMTPREIYKTRGPSVVLIFGTDGGSQGSAGTGSIISREGRVITNAHVVAHDGTPFKKLFVYLKPEKVVGDMKEDLKRRLGCSIVAMEPQLDLALLQLENPPEDLPTIEFADPNDVEVGDPMVAIGHPETGGLWTLTTGSISAVIKDFTGVKGKDVFQTEASVNRGNSGGPLLNNLGNMVGINTAISRRAADGLAITSINFSMKSSVVVKWLGGNGMQLAFAKGAGGGGTAVAAKSAGSSASAGGGGGTKVAAVTAADQGGDDTPAPSRPQAGGEPTKVSAHATIPGGGGGGGGGKKVDAKKAAPPQKTEILTEKRPYQLDKFVEDRIKEMKALEDIMDDAKRKIDAKKGKKSMMEEF